MRSAPAITFDYRPSRALAVALCAVAALAAAAIMTSGLAAAFKIAGTVVAIAYSAVVIWRMLRAPVKRCAWHAGGEWRVRDREGNEHVATLRHAAVRGPLIALVLRAGALRDVSIVLLPDNSDAELRRQLRVRLARTSTEAAEPA